MLTGHTYFMNQITSRLNEVLETYNQILQTFLHLVKDGRAIMLVYSSAKCWNQESLVNAHELGNKCYKINQKNNTLMNLIIAKTTLQSTLLSNMSEERNIMSCNWNMLGANSVNQILTSWSLRYWLKIGYQSFYFYNIANSHNFQASHNGINNISTTSEWEPTF